MLRNLFLETEDTSASQVWAYSESVPSKGLNAVSLECLLSSATGLIENLEAIIQQSADGHNWKDAGYLTIDDRNIGVYKAVISGLTQKFLRIAIWLQNTTDDPPEGRATVMLSADLHEADL